MNYKLLLLGLMVVGISSCSTAYKAGQTPDDVYYSPAREVIAKKETRQENRYESMVRNEEDQYLRMKVRNRTRWSTIDDYDYWYDSRYDYGRYNYNYYNQYGWNNWNMGYHRPFWPGNYYNGWHPGFGYGGYPIIINKGSIVPPTNVSRPSLKGYNNAGYNNSNLGNSIKKVFTPNNSSYNNSNSNSERQSERYSTTPSSSTPSRTYNPPSSSSSSSGSSSSSSGSSSGGVTRPSRGGN